MSKSEFLRILKESLSGVLEKSDLNDQLDYYEKYIDDEMKSGRTEKEVIDELGDPRLIAKTIKTVSSSGSSSDSVDNKSYSNKQRKYDDTYDNNSSSNTSYRRTNNRYSGSQDNGGYMSVGGQNAMIGCIIALLVIFIIVSLIMRFIGSVAFSGPIGFILVLGLFYFLFGRGRR